MEFKGEIKAEEYALGKSSSSVFRESHIKDYLAGYNQAIKDLKASEMLEMLNNCYEYFLNNTSLQSENNADAIGQLIKEVTGL